MVSRGTWSCYVIVRYASHGCWPDEADAKVEHHPAEDGEQQDGFAFIKAVSYYTPKRCAAKLNEVTDPHQETTLARRHAQLLVVDSQERMQGPVRGIEKEVEDLGDQETLIYSQADSLQTVCTGRGWRGQGVSRGR